MWKIKLVSQKFRKDYFKPLKIKQRQEMKAQQAATQNIQQVEEQEVEDALPAAAAVESITKHHKDEKKAPSSLKQEARLYKCDECGKSLTKASSLRQHMAVHSGKRF